MSIDPKTRSALTRLTTSIGMVEKPGKFTPWLSIPRDLREQAQEASLEPGMGLILGDNCAKFYREALLTAQSDQALEHLSPKEINSDVRRLIWEAYILSPKKALSSTDARNLVQSLESMWMSTVMEYEVVVPLSHLRMDDQELSIGSCKIQKVDSTLLEHWTPTWKEDGSGLDLEIGMVVAVTSVSAGSSKVAFERASTIVDESLDVLRTSVSGFRFMIHDNELGVARTQDSYAMPPLSREVIHQHIDLSQNLHDLNLVGPLAEWTNNNLEKLEYIWSLPPESKLRASLLRAIRWIGSSIQRNRFDDKVTDLCAALECLLSDKGDRFKSDMIVCRSMSLSKLVNDGFTHPEIVIQLYEARSQIVHGSDLYICSEDDYRSLLHCTIKILKQLIALLEQDKNITTKAKALKTLSSPEQMKECRQWLLAQNDPGIKALAKRLWPDT